jgi:hypothetical protein
VALAVISFEGMLIMDEGPWTIASAIGALAGLFVAALVLGLTLYSEVFRPRSRRKKLSRPCDAYFSIPPSGHEHGHFAIQDGETHIVKEITLPAHSTVKVEIQCYPRVPYIESEFAFGCPGDHLNDAKPYAEAWRSFFTVEGISRATPRRGEPDFDPAHYTDRHRYYHIRQSKQRSPGQTYVVGFEIKTQNPGSYAAEVWSTTEEMQGVEKLTIHVEDVPSRAMWCALEKHPQGCTVKPNPDYPRAVVR